MAVCTSGDLRKQIGHISFVWGDGPATVAAIVTASVDGDATCWLNRRAVHGLEYYWLMRWTRHAVANGWRFATVRTDELAVLRV